MKSVRHSDKFIKTVSQYANKNKRTIPKQIEYWAQIGKLMEDNPKLSLTDIQREYYEPR